jgi:hypothetical protein
MSNDHKPIMLPVPALTSDASLRSPTALPPEVQDAAAERRREAQERDAAVQAEAERAHSEQQQVRVIDADTAARRGEASSTLARSACIAGGATLAGLLVAGPVGAVVGCLAGWIANATISRR